MDPSERIPQTPTEETIEENADGSTKEHESFKKTTFVPETGQREAPSEEREAEASTKEEGKKKKYERFKPLTERDNDQSIRRSVLKGDMAPCSNTHRPRTIPRQEEQM